MARLEYKVYRNDEEKAKLYNRRLYAADNHFDTWSKKARDWWKRYENEPRQQQVNQQAHRVNNVTGVATIDALFSALTAVDVDILATPIGRATPDQAELATAALAKEWAVQDVQGSTNDAIKDALVSSIGWAKVSYEYVSELKNFPRPIEAVRQEITQLLQQAAEAGGEAPDLDDIMANVPLEEEREQVLVDRVVVDYVAWDDVRVDPTAKRFRQARWVAQYIKMRPEEVKQNEVWREYVKRNQGGLKLLEGIKADSTVDQSLLKNQKPTDDESFTTVVEMHDFETGTICTFAKGAKFLLNETANPLAANYEFPDRSMFVPLVLRGTTGRIRGVGDMELMAPTLDELDIYRSALANYTDRHVPKMAGPEDALTDEGKEALGSRKYGDYVAIDQKYGADGGKLLNPLNPPAMPSEVFGIPEKLENSLREATGVNELMRGLFPDRKRTATETAEVVSASAARQAEKRNTLEAFYLAIARRILQLMQAYYDQPRMLRYVDPGYGSIPWDWSAEDIVGEFDITLSLTPKEAETRQSMRDDAMAFLNMVIVLAQPGPDGQSVINMEGLAKWFMRKFGLSRAEANEILNTAEEKQVQQAAGQQAQAAQANAAAGVPRPDMTTGPLKPAEVAQMANTGGLPPETAIAATAGGSPFNPAGVEAVSEER